MTHLLRNIDLEGNTMAIIGVMEMKMLDALLMGGLENAMKERAVRDGIGALGF